jgi:hypothetical protein
VQSFFREYNESMLADLTVHEAMPGHYLQIMHSNTYPSKLRAVLGSGPVRRGLGGLQRVADGLEGIRRREGEAAAAEDDPPHHGERAPRITASRPARWTNGRRWTS